MKRFTFLLLASVVGVLLGESFAHAQTPGNPPIGAGYSPYLNLLRRGNSTLQNYYGIVRPEINYQNQAALLQQQVTANRNDINQQQQQQQQGANQLPRTGHNFGYFTHQSYFLNNRGGGRTGGGGGGTGVAGNFGGTSGGASRPPTSGGSYAPRASGR